MYEIDKTFSFCYSHRVFVQKLDLTLTERGHTKPKCRMIHGHEGKVQVFLQSEQLNEQKMVFDFVCMGHIKDFLDDYIDHRFILSKDDPWFSNIVNATQNWEDGKLISLTTTQPLNTTEGNTLDVYPVYVPDTQYLTGYNIDVSNLQGPEQEFFESFFIVNIIPTSEALSKWLFDIVDTKLSPLGVIVSKISWNETPKSRAVYSRPT
jgi:6-pyruvoyltetrahydropterin/6-carboxytetrahydropterin synthase